MVFSACESISIWKCEWARAEMGYSQGGRRSKKNKSARLVQRSETNNIKQKKKFRRKKTRSLDRFILQKEIGSTDPR